ncbi:MAG: hypothetical protein Q8P80_02580 [Candidatus Levybacteria bacterium]|nr:hypothetical protein [Candidatus Levybacteria bacterium]
MQRLEKGDEDYSRFPENELSNIQGYLKPDLTPKVKAVDTVTLEDGLTLPEGVTIDDVQDAINRAKLYEGQDFSVQAYITNKIIFDGVEYGGIHVTYDGVHYIGISINHATESSHLTDRNLPKGYKAGSLREQIWSAAFEETLHAARTVSCKQDPNYFIPKSNSAEEFQRYYEQKEEQLVNVALSYVLKEKFGPSACEYHKAVIHAPLAILSTVSPTNRDICSVGRERLPFEHFPHKNQEKPQIFSFLNLTKT